MSDFTINCINNNSYLILDSFIEFLLESFEFISFCISGELCLFRPCNWIHALIGCAIWTNNVGDMSCGKFTKCVISKNIIFMQDLLDFRTDTLDDGQIIICSRWLMSGNNTS